MPSIVAQIQSIGSELSLTPYGISHRIAAETDCSDRERMACEKRWQGYTKGRGLRQISQIEADLLALGYTIQIKKELQK
jgi:hypothetical protein